MASDQNNSQLFANPENVLQCHGPCNPPFYPDRIHASCTMEELRLYIVKKGIKPGVYTSWESCQEQIDTYRFRPEFYRRKDWNACIETWQKDCCPGPHSHPPPVPLLDSYARWNNWAARKRGVYQHRTTSSEPDVPHAPDAAPSNTTLPPVDITRPSTPDANPQAPSSPFPGHAGLSTPGASSSSSVASSSKTGKEDFCVVGCMATWSCGTWSCGRRRG
ncbi:uncharacterized protein EV420DRAFT_1753928 [Desarmillaria tabescens]|uniref:Ribonuclease H1 N-terminal domain-containing protein n=1 Tax=Armillaria tabescens TaxID=1929756 RepID=A0AA39MJA4_ARMTA|nr:uncharacterized protein EV420DRAFT_1753928 [Desarmillaria tabescens]KAK0435933.1 hypothetical protein EV420DRAFT_1753928 [Desarmillaria tabescens]